MVKEKSDIDAIGEFATAPKCDVAEVNRTATEMGKRGIVRGHVCCFALVAPVLAITALLASWGPALKAALVDPLMAPRYE